jgi:hypothetical protein
MEAEERESEKPGMQMTVDDTQIYVTPLAGGIGWLVSMKTDSITTSFGVRHKTLGAILGLIAKQGGLNVQLHVGGKNA